MASEKYKECQLGEWIVPHIIKDLYIKSDLAQKVLEYKDIKSSVRTTFIPDDWDMKMLEREYLELDTSRNTALSWLARKVQEFVFGGDDQIGIFENPFARPNAPWFVRKKVPFIAFDDEVLLDIYGKNAESLEYIEQRINLAEGASYLFGIMSSLPKSSLPLAQTIDEDTVDLLAKRCEGMIVFVFDGTGYIICSFKK